MLGRRAASGAGGVGVTLRSAATGFGSWQVHAEADLDFRGVIEHRQCSFRRFSAIRLRFDSQSDATPEDLDALIAATERYCTVYQTLSRPPGLSMHLAGVDSTEREPLAFPRSGRPVTNQVTTPGNTRRRATPSDTDCRLACGNPT